MLPEPRAASRKHRYDGEGRRIEKVAGSATTQWLYNGSDLYAQYGASWASAAALYTGGTDLPLIQAASSGGSFGAATYYYQDGLGSVVGLSNNQGSTTQTQRFDAWGNPLSGTIPQSAQYGFTGREPDETGLVYYRARYYSPSIGRFVSADPSGLAAGINPYAYAGDNPVNLTDPSGLLARQAAGTVMTYYGEASDWASSVNLGTRLGGAAQLAGGVVEGGVGVTGIGAGLATSEVGVGIPIAAAGFAALSLGADQASTGLQTLLTGQRETSLLNQGLQAAGASPQQAGVGEVAVNSLLTGGVAVGTSVVESAALAAANGAAPITNLAAEGATTSVFWTGNGSRAVADAWASANGGQTLSMSKFAVSETATAEAAQSASLSFAQAASGNVTVFQSASFVPVNGIWATTEFPALMANPNVTGVTYNILNGSGATICTILCPK